MSLKFTLDSWLLSSCLTIYIPSYHKRYNFMVNLSGSYSFNVMLTNSYFVLFKMFLTEFLHVTLLFAAFGSLLFSAVEGKNKDFGPSVKDAILTGLRQLKENGKSCLVLYLFFIISHYSYVVVNMLLSLLLC